MKIALIGHGKMAQAVQELALQDGHKVTQVVRRRDNPPGTGFLCDWVAETEVVIDFSVADAVPSNVANAVAAGLPLVEGTTGWQDRLEEVRQIVEQGGGAVLHSSNFSLGVQALFYLVREAGQLFARLKDYSAFIEERHHEQKKDAPSGTALSLKRILEEEGVPAVPVCSVRAGQIPGSHEVGFDSIVDTLTLTHVARSRQGFARGALFAADWIRDKKGFFDLREVLFK